MSDEGTPPAHDPPAHDVVCAMPPGAPAYCPPHGPAACTCPQCAPVACTPGAHVSGGPVLFSPPGSGSNMIISGPAIVQTGWPAATAGHGKDGHGDGHDKGDGLPKNWNVPESVGREIMRLVKLADEGDAPLVTVGGAQAILATLLAEFPDDVRDPKPKKLSWWQEWFGSTPPPSDKDKKGRSLAILERACKEGLITRSMLDAAHKLPLETSQAKGGSSKGKAFVRFIVELADVIYAQPSRMA